MRNLFKLLAMFFGVIVCNTTMYASGNETWINEWSTKSVSVGVSLNTFEPNTWYFFYQGRPPQTNSYIIPAPGEYPPEAGGFLADNGIGKIIKKNAIERSAHRADQMANYLVRFQPISGKTGVYHVQFGTGNYMTGPNGSGNSRTFTTTSDINDAGTFNIYNIDAGYIGFNVYDMGACVDNDGTGQNVLTWGTGRQTQTSGSNGIWNVVDVVWDGAADDTPESTSETVMHTSMWRNSLVYYDYDGDGKMEMFGYYKNKESDRFESFGLMNDDQLLKTYGTSGCYKYFIADGNAISVINGNGQLCIGNHVLQANDSWLDITRSLHPEGNYLKAIHVDIDNDGRMDLAMLRSGKPVFLIQQEDGTFLQTTPRITIDSTYIPNSVSTNNVRTKGARKIMSMSASEALTFNMVVSGLYSGSTDSRFSQVIDLNGDGRPDLLTVDGKSAFLSTGENAYCPVAFKGKIYPYDLNGDGIHDYVLYDGESIYTVIRDAEGIVTQKKIFSNSAVKHFLCRDFDLDGDVDVLAYIMDETNTYFVFMRNDGDGSFKKKEAHIENGHSFIECKDYDADGLYEVLISPIYMDKSGSGHGQEKPVNKILKINKDFSMCDVSEPLPEEMMIMNLGDFDNDGFTDFKLVNGYIHARAGSDRYNYISVSQVAPHITGRYSKQTIQNTAPKKMPKPTLVLDENTGYLRIIWQRGEDAETSACDLTYEVRIGTAPGKGDILCAPSLADGRRRLIADGGMGTQLQTLFNIGKQKPGTYYVAVQAIDAGGLGGAWSDEATYENSYTAPVILAETTQTSTADTVTVVAGKYNENVTYRWSVSNGEIISQEKNQAQVIFHAGGVQQVMLTTTWQEGEYQSVPLDIIVGAYSSQRIEGGRLYPSGVIFDINQDGYPDGIGNGYFMINDGKGSFSKYPKSFNADLKGLSSSRAIDINRDGFPDIIGHYSPKGNIFLNDGEGDFEPEYRDFELIGGTWGSDQRALNQHIISSRWVDFSNTGLYEAINGFSNTAEVSLYKTNDYVTFTPEHIEELPGGAYAVDICDINRDGFMDFVCMRGGASASYAMNGVYAMINRGDGTFRKMAMLEDVNGELKSAKIADLNNDGIPDIVVLRWESKVYMLELYLGNNNNEWNLSLTIPDVKSLSGINDFDNNGFLDLVTSIGTIYFFNDLKYEIINPNISGDSESYTFMVFDGNGYPKGGSYYLYSSSIKNEVPKAPSTVSVKQTPAGMVINWTDAEDDHTPACQMRYNISVKRKGKYGEGSYIISPMNGGSSQAALVFHPNDYKQATTMTIPGSALTVGETYEVRVQAIDLWNQWSPMSVPVEITITAANGNINAPDLACVGRETTIRYTGVIESSETIDFGDDSRYTKEGGTFVVTWSSDGVKDITIGKMHSQIIVEKPIDITFALPEDVFVGAELPIAISKGMSAKESLCGLRFIESPNRAKTAITFRNAESMAILRFDKAGTYIVESYCEDSVLGGTFQQTMHVKEAPTVEVDRIDIDEASGKYAIQWNPSKLPSSIRKIVVYKERTNQNKFDPLDTLEVNVGRYIDFTSSPQSVAARYKIALLSNGGQTVESMAHKPMHIMVGTSAMGGYNLMWNSYEGKDVDNYKIWRGTSADNLQLLTQVAGNVQNYTDLSAPVGEVFYAVSFEDRTQAETKTLKARRISTTRNDITSNIVSTKYAVNIIQATSLEIITIDNSLELNNETPTLQLYSLLLPAYCTFDKVAWYILEGEEYATISSSGLLTAREGIGTVKVGASSIDGSNLTAEISISVSIKKPTFNLIYLVDGETYLTQSLLEGESITPESYPKREGYTFSGWSEIPATMPDHDVEITGTFTVNSYTVTFKYGDEVLTTASVDYGAEIPLPESLGSERYTLVEWKNVPETMPAYNITIFAIYTDGVSAVQDDNPDAEYYQLNGTKRNNLQRGINIVRANDGTTKKVLRR